jgi:hypothetical protein
MGYEKNLFIESDELKKNFSGDGGEKWPKQCVHI